MTALIVTLIVLASIAAWFAMAVVTTRIWCGKDPEKLQRHYGGHDRDDVWMGFLLNCLIWPLTLPVGLVRRVAINTSGDAIRLLDPRFAEKERREEKASALKRKAFEMADIAKGLTDDTEYKLIAEEARRLLDEAEKFDPIGSLYHSTGVSLSNALRRNR
jgi:hypothetical protein